MTPIIAPSSALEVATGAAAATLTTSLDDSQRWGEALYVLGANQDFWFSQGANDTVFTADSTTDKLTATAHKIHNGQALQVSNSGGALPGGLSATTTYWAIYVDANTFKLATSYANAVAGTAIDITSNGTGTQTASVVATAGSGSAFVPGGSLVLIDGAFGAKVSVIQDSTTGKASVAKVFKAR